MVGLKGNQLTNKETKMDETDAGIQSDGDEAGSSKRTKLEVKSNAEEPSQRFVFIYGCIWGLNNI